MRSLKFHFVFVFLFAITIPNVQAAGLNCSHDALKAIGELKDQTGLIEAFLRISHQCPKKIWPTFDLKNKDVIFYNEESTNSLKISVTEDQVFLKNISSAQLKADPKYQSSYHFFSNKGRDAVAVNVVDRKNSNVIAFSLAIHEAFHKYNQDWKVKNEGNVSMSRATVYPVDWKPLYYRNMITKHLQLSLMSSPLNRASLCQVQYWQKRLKSEYSTELQKIKHTDSVEGSANYVELRAYQIARHPKGCEAGPTELDTIQPPDFLDMKLETKIASQSYHLGSLAGRVLDRIDRTGKWKNQMMSQGSTPVDTLTATIKNCPSQSWPDDSKIKNEIRKIVDEKNLDNREEFDPLVDNWQSQDLVRVSLPRESMQGAYSVQGFYELADIQETTLFRSLKTNIKNETTDVSISNENALEVESNENPCGKRTVTILVPKADLPSSGKIELDTAAGTQGTIRKYRRVNHQGKTWICAD